MAKKRMFSQEVVRSDDFLDLPQSSQLLYFHFGMIADDDGIVASVERELRYLGFGSKDDLKILSDKNFIDFTVDGKLVFIVHWLKNNNLRPDRYLQTDYKAARAELEAKGYQFKGKKAGTPLGIPNDNRSAATDTEKDKEKDKEKGLEKDIDKGKGKDTDSLLSEFLDIFINLSGKNRSKRAVATTEFINLPPFQREQAVVGAKNYVQSYRNEHPEDEKGQYSVNAANFLSNMMFMDYQKKVKADTGYDDELGF